MEKSWGIFLVGITFMALISIYSVILIHKEVAGIRQETERILILQLLQEGQEADYIIPTGVYEGELASGFCLPSKTKLIKKL